jgi:hypothetical protein
LAYWFEWQWKNRGRKSNNNFVSAINILPHCAGTIFKKRKFTRSNFHIYYHILLQAVGRFWFSYYESVYGIEIDQTSASSQQYTALILLTVITPFVSVGYLCIFLYMQPEAYGHFVAMLRCQSYVKKDKKTSKKDAKGHGHSQGCVAEGGQMHPSYSYPQSYPHAHDVRHSERDTLDSALERGDSGVGKLSERGSHTSLYHTASRPSGVGISHLPHLPTAGSSSSFAAAAAHTGGGGFPYDTHSLHHHVGGVAIRSSGASITSVGTSHTHLGPGADDDSLHLHPRSSSMSSAGAWMKQSFGGLFGFHGDDDHHHHPTHSGAGGDGAGGRDRDSHHRHIFPMIMVDYDDDRSEDELFAALEHDQDHGRGSGYGYGNGNGHGGAGAGDSEQGVEVAPRYSGGHKGGGSGGTGGGGGGGCMHQHTHRDSDDSDVVHSSLHASSSRSTYAGGSSASNSMHSAAGLGLALAATRAGDAASPTQQAIAGLGSGSGSSHGGSLHCISSDPLDPSAATAGREG